MFDVLLNILSEITNIIYVFSPLFGSLFIRPARHRWEVVVVLHIVVSAVEGTILKCLV